MITRESYEAFVNRKKAPDRVLDCGLSWIPLQVLHASFGMTTEAAEFQDVLKKTLYKNTKLDWVNMDEEVGDMLFFIQMYINERNLVNDTNMTFEDYLNQNMAKLDVRYREGFTIEEATNRDLGQERSALEAHSDGQTD